MQTRSFIRLSAALSLVIVAAMSRSAEAHFMLGAPTSWWTQASDGSPQKNPPCGNEAFTGTAATGTVNVFQPGQPVTVTVTSTIAHPGWWRISLREGRTSTQTATAFPDPPELGGPGTAQQCTPAFIDNPVWSTTQPVLADKLGMPAGSTSTTTNQSGTKTFSVTIPASARCTSANPCTLQVLMIMTDHTFPTCNYHHCADMAVASDGGVTDAGGGTGGASGGTGGRAGTGGSNGAAGSPGTAGTSGTGGSNGAAGARGVGGTSGGGVGGAPGSAGQNGGNNGVGGGVDAGNINVETGSAGCASCAVGARGAGAAGWTAAGLLIAGLLLRRRRRG